MLQPSIPHSALRNPHWNVACQNVGNIGNIGNIVVNQQLARSKSATPSATSATLLSTNNLPAAPWSLAVFNGMVCCRIKGQRPGPIPALGNAQGQESELREGLKARSNRLHSHGRRRQCGNGWRSIWNIPQSPTPPFASCQGNRKCFTPTQQFKEGYCPALNQ